jgi:hypothetical protein
MNRTDTTKQYAAADDHEASPADSTVFVGQSRYRLVDVVVENGVTIRYLVLEARTD